MIFVPPSTGKKTMLRFLSLCWILIVVFSASLAAAGDGVQITEASGRVHHHIWGSPTPVPAYCYWELELPTPQFHATNSDGYGNTDCPHYWLAHCDNDSLTFHGTWPVIDSPLARSAEYLVDLSCSFTVTSETLLAARRTIGADLDTDLHTLVIVFSDGSEEILLGQASEADQAQIVLLPGNYVAHLEVNAYRNKIFSEDLPPYSGWVSLRFGESGPVDTRQDTWDSIKAVYRSR
jgi:hypothetical protein